MELSTLIKTARPDSLDAPELPQPKFKTLVIAHNYEHARLLRFQYVDPAYMNERDIRDPAHGPPHFYVTFPGHMIGRRRFTNIVIQSRVLEALQRDPKAWDWYNHIALCRLVAGGQVKVVN